MIVIDGNDKIIGRVSTYIAKQLLQGEKVAIVNAEKLVISGTPEAVHQKYFKRREIQTKERPELKPRWPRKPDLLVKRIIRGMLPWRSARGREAFRRLKVYIGAPEEFMKMEKTAPKSRHDSSGLAKYITVEDLCKKLGYSR